ncbi:MAG: FIST C-terminal domain-containing protein [Elusimicrobia bacterium]|nr:FIST C-terminal domain-containing protein [Elusimicrobiota bacterium]
MRWASAISERPSIEEAVRECAGKVQSALDGQADLAILFLSQHFQADYEEAPKLVDRLLKPRHLLGCSAGGVIAAGREVEHKPGVALAVARLPDVALTPFRLEMSDLPDPDAPPGAWANAIGLDRSAKPSFILLADPFTFNPEDLVRGLDYAFPQSVKVGGLASGAMRPGQNVLIADGACLRSGAVGVACSGNLVIDPIVAQGCRPVGKALKITECHQNHLVTLDGKPALKAVEELLESLPEEDQQLARTSLFLGIVTDPFRSGTDKRDYLIRNLVGLDPESGTLAIGAIPRPGQTVQFHLRDKRASAEDLDLMLGRYAESKPTPAPAGALLFSCLGRGKHLYGVPNHDSDTFRRKLGPLPIGGFFCNGEIGPVEGATHLHGYTSCFGIFRPRK